MSNYSSQSQADKRQRGENFQEEIRRSWALIPNCWRMRITDDCGSRPADEIVILPHVNFLIEMKRKADDRLNLADLRTNQIGGLIDFIKAGNKNVGMIFVSFLSESVDATYAISIRTFLQHLKKMDRLYMDRQEISEYQEAILLPRIMVDADPANNLRGLVDWFK